MCDLAAAGMETVDRVATEGLLNDRVDAIGNEGPQKTRVEPNSTQPALPTHSGLAGVDNGNYCSLCLRR